VQETTIRDSISDLVPPAKMSGAPAEPVSVAQHPHEQLSTPSASGSSNPTAAPSIDVSEMPKMLKEHLRHLRPQTPVITRKQSTNLMEDYFVSHQKLNVDDRDSDDEKVGPARLDKFSKWPTFLRLYGSILPEMVIPLLFVAGWSSAVVCISILVTSRECFPSRRHEHVSLTAEQSP
jgi:hypothetical protein